MLCFSDLYIHPLSCLSFVRWLRVRQSEYYWMELGSHGLLQLVHCRMLEQEQSGSLHYSFQKQRVRTEKHDEEDRHYNVFLNVSLIH